NAQGQGAGFVSYRITPLENRTTGTKVTATARVLLNNVPPEDTPPLTYTIDGAAPTTTLTVQPVTGTSNYRVTWNAVDDQGGSGVKHVTLYVATDGGGFKIWQRQLPDASGTMVFTGVAGHHYEFLALATDLAGNHEMPPVGTNAEDDGSRANLGSTPQAG